MSQQDDCYVEPFVKPLDQDAISGAMATYLRVEGMGCPRCATRVSNGLLSLDGVLLAEVHMEQNMAVAAYDPHLVTPADLIAAVVIAGNDGRHNYKAAEAKTMPAIKVIK